MQTGLVSVTFRALAPGEIIDLVTKAGLDGIEWGGDVHVPHGEIEVARKVRQMTVDAGLAVPAYGSYYRVGLGEPVPFETVVATAQALGTGIIRVWAGRKGSAIADRADWDRVVEDSIRCTELAAAAGLSIAFEYHANTLTDTDAAALELLRRVDHPAATTYWQARGHASPEENRASLQTVLPWLSHVHVQSWQALRGQRAPLSAMASPWDDWLALAAAVPGDHAAMIEFVKDDDPAQFLADAAVLKQLTESANERIGTSPAGPHGHARPGNGR